MSGSRWETKIVSSILWSVERIEDGEMRTLRERNGDKHCIGAISRVWIFVSEDSGRLNKKVRIQFLRSSVFRPYAYTQKSVVRMGLST